MPKRKKKCLVCKNEVRTRGLCSNCYKDARVAVLEGKTTWQQLEDKGVALPPKRSPMNEVLSGLNK